MAVKKYQIGVIGYGLSAKIFQIPYILAAQDFELRAIVQRSGDEASKEHPGVKIYRSADELLRDTSIDVIIVSTPPLSHFSLVSSALNADKHVVVEKPFCPLSRECDELIALAQAKGKLLTVFQNRRWDADFVTLQKILADGQLGRVVEFESHFDRYDPEVTNPSAGGAGVIYDLGTHLIDQILFCFGLPSKVTGFLGTQRATNVDGPHDACTVLLHYDSGLLATVKASAVSSALEQLRFWVRGDKGGFKKCHLDPQEHQLVGGMRTDNPTFGLEDAEKAGKLQALSLCSTQRLTLPEGVITLAKNGTLHDLTYPNLPPPTYGAFYEVLSGALAGQCDVPVPAKDARNVIRIIELAEESSRKGSTILLKPEEFV
ncbi:NAD binding Rossmann fold oxidoreductase [Penicillium lagena]|uniref:NAD binding Rossmann fold oxidoreductase n=1 Tax=Penicillium lagena TaxID=94218 RepID=UPI0025405F5C|nr:NAD binding Rossmann fold oxidoreductase [Penicillium lagena]KAJ5626372.1 NAD binding Rossmann fold oxidoreductase [Penicillium lagena]